jgi:hypothetical protein
LLGWHTASSQFFNVAEATVYVGEVRLDRRRSKILPETDVVKQLGPLAKNQELLSGCWSVRGIIVKDSFDRRLFRSKQGCQHVGAGEFDFTVRAFGSRRDIPALIFLKTERNQFSQSGNTSDLAYGSSLFLSPSFTSFIISFISFSCPAVAGVGA